MIEKIEYAHIPNSSQMNDAIDQDFR